MIGAEVGILLECFFSVLSPYFLSRDSSRGSAGVAPTKSNGLAPKSGFSHFIWASDSKVLNSVIQKFFTRQRVL
jgi:hypothetical protein